MSYIKNNIDDIILGRMWFLFSYKDKVSFEKIEGKEIQEDGTIVFGTKAGPEYSHENALHEIAHLIELDSKKDINKIKYPKNWDFRGGKPNYLNGHTWYTYKNDKPVIRELDTWAIQYTLHAYFGLHKQDTSYEDRIRYLVSPMIYLPYDCLIHFSRRFEDGTLNEHKLIEYGVEYVKSKRAEKTLLFQDLLENYLKKIKLIIGED